MPNAHMCSWGTISSRNTSAPSRHHGRTEKTTTTTNPYGYNKQMQSLLRSVTQTVIANTLTHLHTDAIHAHTRNAQTLSWHRNHFGNTLSTFYSIYVQRNNMLARRSSVWCVLSKKYFQFGRNCCWSWISCIRFSLYVCLYHLFGSSLFKWII